MPHIHDRHKDCREHKRNPSTFGNSHAWRWDENYLYYSEEWEVQKSNQEVLMPYEVNDHWCQTCSHKYPSYACNPWKWDCSISFSKGSSNISFKQMKYYLCCLTNESHKTRIWIPHKYLFKKIKLMSICKGENSFPILMKIVNCNHKLYLFEIQVVFDMTSIDWFKLLFLTLTHGKSINMFV